MKKVKYSVLNKLQTLICSIIVGCRYTSDINDILVPDVVAAGMFEIDRFPDQSQINEVLRRMTFENVEELRQVHQTLFQNLNK